MQKVTEKTVNSKLVFDGKIIKVFEKEVLLPEGITAGREIVTSSDAVGVVPVDKGGNVLLVRQYRKAVEKDVLEIPAGRMEKGEKPEDCALRELAEEVGYTAGTLVSLGSYYSSPGFASERIFLYFAGNLSKAEENIISGEIDSIEKIPLTEAAAMALEGKFEDGKTLLGLLLASVKFSFVSIPRHKD